MTTGRIHSYETLGGLDGPGLRTVVFLQGCPLRCGYCHNPDTWDCKGGSEATVAEVMQRIRRYRPYQGRNGGVTFSGGEPLAQAEFVAELAEVCAADGIHTALDTAGYLLNPMVERAIVACSLVILDIKHADPNRYRELTGVDARGMREVLDFTARIRKPTWIRQVVVPGWNDRSEDILALADLIRDHPARQRAELLAYHDMGLHKWQAMGMVSPFAQTPSMPAGELAALQTLLDQALAEETTPRNDG
jgi:pyruvate formate lyase activating enzyme